MPREKKSYRGNLERLNEYFPDREMLTVADLVRFTGRSRGTVDKITAGHRIKPGNIISKASFARLIST